MATAFQKPFSVFADWKEDSTEVIDKCLQHDFGRWKLDFVRNPTDLMAIKQFFKDQFSRIKEVRMGTIALGNPHQMHYQEFMKLCQMAKITDENFTTQ